MKKNLFLALILSSVFLIFSCTINKKESVQNYLSVYLDVVSKEHALYKKNVTNKMQSFYYDDEYREEAEYPNFMELKPFSNKIVYINNDYKILKCQLLKSKSNKKIYEIHVEFNILNKDENKHSVIMNYWVIDVENNLYIYADPFLTDIFIFEKDIEILLEE